MASYVDRLLAPGERVLYRTRRHALVVLRGVAGALLLAAAGVAAVVVGWNLERSGELGTPWTLVGAGLAVLGVVLAIPAYLHWRCEEYLVTDRRVIQAEGVLEKRVLDSSVDKVNDVLLTQSLLGRLLDFGTLSILTASEAGVNRLDTLPRPMAFKHAILRAKGTESDVRSAGDFSSRLEDLTKLRARGLLSEEEFQAKRRAILEDL